MITKHQIMKQVICRKVAIHFNAEVQTEKPQLSTKVTNADFTSNLLTKSTQKSSSQAAHRSTGI